jgi:GAF domain-containing protein
MTGEMLAVPGLGSGYAGISPLLLSRETVDAALRLVTSLAREMLHGTAAAGVTVAAGDQKVTTAGSDPLVETADGLQYGLDEGPCLTAWRERVVVRTDELRTETRWPRWTKAVEPLGLRASLSSPLVTGGKALGVIKVYARESAVYDEHAERLLSLLAQQAVILLGGRPAPRG